MKEVSNKEFNEINQLTNFALKAKEEIQISNNLHILIDLYKNYIKEIKNILFSKESIGENIKNLNNKLNNNIEKVQKEYQKLKNKYDTLYLKCTDELEMDRPNLNQVKQANFILEYSLIQKDFFIQKLKESIKISRKYNIFREPKREDYNEINNINKSIKIVSEESQLNLLLKSKKYNKLKAKMKKKREKKNKLEKEIKNLNELINNIKIESKLMNQNKQIFNSENKTLTDTPSTNKETNKISENQKVSKDSENFVFFEKTKKFKEDSFINDENKYYKKSSKNIKKAILSTKIPQSFGSIKSMSVNPMLNEGLPKNEIYIDNNNLNDNDNDNDNDNNDTNEFKNKKFILNKNINLNKALSEENRKNKKINNPKKNKIIQSFLNLEDLFEITDSDNEDEGVLIESVLHSDDETILENKINSKKTISKTYKDNIEKKIPKINLSLIEYNKLKVYQEIDLYSLQRRKYKGQNIEDNIKILSKKLKKLKLKENLNNKKVKVMKKFIDDLKDKYKLYKKIIIKTTANNSKTKYISNNEIIDINKIENENESENEVGSDYLNEDDEISENN